MDVSPRAGHVLKVVLFPIWLKVCTLLGEMMECFTQITFICTVFCLSHGNGLASGNCSYSFSVFI